MSKKYYMVLDVETVADARIPYDVAYILIDREGKIIERFNALVAEVMENDVMRYMLARDSFAKRKADFYLNNCNAPVRDFVTIADYVRETIRTFNAVVVAYNAAFDTKVLQNMAQICDNGADFWPDDCQVWDLWHMALNTVCDSGNYVRYCIDNGYLTDKGNISTSAEAVYAYLTNTPNFEEEHTALADCEIEAQILTAIFKRKQKLTTDFCAPVFRRPVWQKRCKMQL